MSTHFTKYTKVDNSYVKPLIARYFANGYGDLTWIATEKVHGANFSLVVTDTDVTCACRNMVLGSKEAERQFYHVDRIKSKYASKVRDMFHVIKPKTCIQVFGELYGGYAPGFEHKTDKAVQKGIVYSPYTRFVVFDIKVDGVSYNDYGTVIALCTQFGIPYVPIKARGTLKELLALNPNFVSQFMQDLLEIGIEEEDSEAIKYLESEFHGKKTNFGEGYMLRPATELLDERGNRVMLKHKGDAFREGHASIHDHVDTIGSSRNVPDAGIIRAYINSARLDSVVSKFANPDNRGDKGKVIKALVADLLDDLKREQPAIDLTNKHVRALISKESSQFVLSWFAQQ